MKLTFKNALIAAIFLLVTKSAIASPTDIESDSHIPLQLRNQQYAQISPQFKDFELLIKAVRQYIIINQFEMESTLNITGDFSGGRINFYININTIMEAPQKFRSDITFNNPNGIRGKQYVVVSDGHQVWIHNLQDKQYSVMDYSSFQESNDNFLIGIVSSILSEFWQNTDNVEIIKNLPEDELIAALENELETDISQIDYEIKNVAGNEYATYLFVDQDQGFTMTTFINTATGEIDYLQMTTVDNQVSLFMEEKVIKKTNLPFINPDTFNFIPPINTKKVVEPLSIEPF